MADELSGSETLDAVLDYKKMYRWEMSGGVENLCRLVSMLGYKDPLRQGIISYDACLGDLTYFLEDNPGAIEAILDWIREQCDRDAEWTANLESELPEDSDDDDEESEMNLRVGMGDWSKEWKVPTFHVFYGKCQVAGQYKTKEQAEQVMREMEIESKRHKLPSP